MTQQEIQLIDDKLSTEVIHRSEGDLLSQAMISKYAADMLIENEKEYQRYVEHLSKTSDVTEGLRNLIDSVQVRLLTTCVRIEEELNKSNKAFEDDITDLKKGLDKYLRILSDATLDSDRITWDNGEIQLGAWTFLSQARQWDLEILKKVESNYKKLDEELKEKLEEELNNFDTTEEVISKVIEELSSAPVIKDLVDLLNSSIEDIGILKEDLNTEVLERSKAIAEEALRMADALADEARLRAEGLAKEAQDRVDEIVQEKNARIEQIEAEVANRIESLEAIKDALDTETEGRLAAIKLLEDDLTKEIQFRKEGDEANLSALENYKTSNDNSLSNIREEIEVNVSAIATNAEKITALDSRLTTNEGEATTAKELAATAVQKANTALTENEAQAELLNDVSTSITALDSELKSKVDASAFNVIKAEVTDINGKLTSATTKITALENNFESLDGGVKANTQTISNLESNQTIQEDKITQLTSDTTLLKNSLSDVENNLATKVDTTAFNNLNTEVTKHGNDITSLASEQTLLKNSLDTVNGTLLTKAEASALNSLTTRVTNAEGVNTSQGTAITSLQNTINHATTGLATKASSSALTVVDNKVTAANGRIDTTNSNVTTLSGRVSTVEGGLSTKADVSALNALTTRVGNVEGGLSTQASDITSLKSSIASTAESVTANGSQATLDTIGLPAANVLLSANTDSMTGNLIKLKGQVHSPVTNSKMLIDPTKLYKLRMRFRRTAGTDNRIYVAVINYNASGDRTVTVSNTLNAVGTPINNANYPISNELPALNLWREVEYYFKGKSTGASTGSGTLASPRTFPALAATVDIGVLANYTKGNVLTQEYEIDYLIFEDATAEAANEVNASAITSTNTEVSRINGVVSGHTTQLSNLTASIAGKADTSALNALTARVTAEEGKTVSQASEITSLNTTLNKTITDLTYTDTRNDNQPPQWYRNNYPRKTTKEFKLQTTIGANTFFSGTYCLLETNVGWPSAASGAAVTQTATSSDDPSLYIQRRSTGTIPNETWTAWSQPIKALRDDLGTKASASALSTLDTKVTNINGVVTSQASQITTLTSDNAANKNALQVQGQVINGVKANYMVKMETNGVIGGFGLLQTTGALGQVQTSFGVNANAFFIGAPASKKQPFIVTTTNQVVNGVTYPAGTYIDVALIANATIGNAKIADLAVTGAKIAKATITDANISSLNAGKITAGTMHGDRITAGTLKADRLSVAALDAIAVRANNITITAADGSKTVQSGGLTEVFYPNGKIAIRLGIK